VSERMDDETLRLWREIATTQPDRYELSGRKVARLFEHIAALGANVRKLVDAGYRPDVLREEGLYIRKEGEAQYIAVLRLFSGIITHDTLDAAVAAAAEARP